MTVNISLEKLLEYGAHFGHQARRWNPKIAPYIYGVEEGIHVFDLVKTKEALLLALEALKKAHQEGKVILFVGTKKQAKEAVKKLAQEKGFPYVVERWLGGTLTNFEQMGRSIKKFSEMKQKMSEGAFKDFTKKENLTMNRKVADFEKFFGGIAALTRLPDVLVIVDTRKEHGAIVEASKMGIPTIAIVDSNSDPTEVSWPIPMNDDSARAIKYVLELMGKMLSKPGKKAKK